MVTQNSWNSQDPAQVAKGGTGRATLTAYNIPVGNGTTQVTLVAPSATSGVPVISQGAAANPAYGTAVVAGGGTGRATSTAYAVLCGGTTSTSAQQSLAGVGTSGQVLTSNGAAALPTFQAAGGGGAGSIVQEQIASNTTGTLSSATIPFDSSIPQNTEGVELMTQAITPTNASNIIEVAYFSYASSPNASVTGAFFVDSTANAVQAQAIVGPATTDNTVAMYYRVVAGSTSARTYKIRAGAHFSTNVGYNRDKGVAGVYGGIQSQYFRIREIAV